MIICIDRITAEDISRIIKKTPGVYEKNEQKSHLVGWGEISAEVIHYESAGRKFGLVRFPHLSRYKIFNRKESETEIDTIMKKLRIYLN